MFWVALFVLYVIVAITAGVIASNKNRCVACWVLACLLLSPFVILILLALQPLSGTDDWRARQADRYAPRVQHSAFDQKLREWQRDVAARGEDAGVWANPPTER